MEIYVDFFLSTRPGQPFDYSFDKFKGLESHVKTTWERVNRDYQKTKSVGMLETLYGHFRAVDSAELFTSELHLSPFLSPTANLHEIFCRLENRDISPELKISLRKMPDHYFTWATALCTDEGMDDEKLRLIYEDIYATCTRFWNFHLRGTFERKDRVFDFLYQGISAEQHERAAASALLLQTSIVADPDGKFWFWLSEEERASSSRAQRADEDMTFDFFFQCIAAYLTRTAAANKRIHAGSDELVCHVANLETLVAVRSMEGIIGRGLAGKLRAFLGAARQWTGESHLIKELLFKKANVKHERVHDMEAYWDLCDKQNIWLDRTAEILQNSPYLSDYIERVTGIFRQHAPSGYVLPERIGNLLGPLVIYKGDRWNRGFQAPIWTSPAPESFSLASLHAVTVFECQARPLPGRVVTAMIMIPGLERPGTVVFPVAAFSQHPTEAEYLVLPGSSFTYIGSLLGHFEEKDFDKRDLRRVLDPRLWALLCHPWYGGTCMRGSVPPAPGFASFTYDFYLPTGVTVEAALERLEQIREFQLAHLETAISTESPRGDKYADTWTLGRPLEPHPVNGIIDRITKNQLLQSREATMAWIARGRFPPEFFYGKRPTAHVAPLGSVGVTAEEVTAFVDGNPNHNRSDLKTYSTRWKYDHWAEPHAAPKVETEQLERINDGKRSADQMEPMPEPLADAVDVEQKEPSSPSKRAKLE